MGFPRWNDDSSLRHLGYNLELAEPYLEENGKLGVIIPYNGYVNCRSLSEWTEYDERLGKYLSNRFKENRIFWHLPGKPDMGYDDPDLHKDMVRAIDPFVDFHDDRLPSLFASWIIGTYINDFLPKSPHLIVQGPTGSGKGRVIQLVRLLAYRGVAQSNPTWAVLARMSGWYRTTFALEETQDISDNDLKLIWNVYKNAFDRLPSFRCNSDISDIDQFQIDRMMAISVKTHSPPEDVLNRGIIFNMRMNSRPVDFDPQNNEVFFSLRTRLHALRFKPIYQEGWIDEYLKDATKKVSEPYFIDGRKYRFEARPRDIARSLLVPGLIFKDTDPIIEIIHESNRKATDTRIEQLETFILLALRDCTKDRHPEKIWRDDILAQLNTILALHRVSSKYGDIDPGKITRTLNSYGFEKQRSTGNISYWDMTSKKNQSTLADHLRALNLEEPDGLS